MSSATALSWFARHEIRLAWREWLAMMTGRRGRKRAAVIGLIIFAVILHFPAYAVIGGFADLHEPLDKSSLIVITSTIFLAWALMLSQAIESVTRVFYARADLDLIMSSPVRLNNIFSVRIAAIALAVIAMALVLSTPFVDVLVIGGGIRWFAAYGVVVAIGLSASAAAIAVTIVLFHAIGPSRTRLVAQILAAIIGAGFVIALQIAAILSYGTLSRFAVLTSSAVAGFAPDAESIVWWPARAMLGDGQALLGLLAPPAARRGDGDLLTAICRHRRQGLGERGDRSGLARQAISRRFTAAGAAVEGARAVAARSMAGVAKPDAAALPGAAGADAVAKFRRQFDRHRADHAGHRDGRGPARGRSGMADDLRGRRRRSGDDGAAAPRARDPRQDRSGADHDRRHLRTADRRACLCLATAGRGHGIRRRCRGGIGHRDPALVPGTGKAQSVSPPPDLVTAGDIRRSLLLDRLGRDRRAGAIDADSRTRHRSDDREHHCGNLEDQPGAGVSGGSMSPRRPVPFQGRSLSIKEICKIAARGWAGKR